jgi:ATP-binding cassette subfamily B protein
MDHRGWGMMIDYLMNRLSLSRKGAKDFVKGTISNFFLDLALMLPALFVFLFLDDYLQPILDSSEGTGKGFLFYLMLGILFLAVSWFVSIIQFRTTFTAVYIESASRRIKLAEKLRKLPLAFFGEKNLSDLTSTIMRDNTELEYTFSHGVPQLVASVAVIVLVAAGMFTYNWQLAIALFWVVPVAFGVILLSKRKQKKNHKMIYDEKRKVSEEIQEGLDTIP